MKNPRAQAATMVIAPRDGRTPLKTLNRYVPPTYTPSGDPLPRARP